MFADWKHAWRQAVENFQRELDEDSGGSPAAMWRDHATAASALRRLDIEIESTRTEAAAERAQEAVCRRREQLARNIGDDETVRLAETYAARHAEYADILERKVEVFVAERTLLARDVEIMQGELHARGVHTAAPAGKVDAGEPTDTKHDAEARTREDARFRQLERERAVEARLEELKKKHR